MRVLLDASLDADTTLKIRQTIAAEPTVAAVAWVTGFEDPDDYRALVET